MMRLCLLLATTVSFGQGYTVTPLGTLPGDSRTDALRAGSPPKEISVVTPEDIEKLWQVAIERGERPSHEGHLSLEFGSGGLRQYVTLTLALGLIGSSVAIERIDFIQEQWQVNVLHQDQIDLWVVSANANGAVRQVWHKLLLEDNGAVLKEEFLPIDEDRTKAIVGGIAARFLPSNGVPPISVTAIMPTADPSRKHAAAKWIAGSFLTLNWGFVRRSKI
jgi:hypothetical protein